MRLMLTTIAALLATTPVLAQTPQPKPVAVAPSTQAAFDQAIAAYARTAGARIGFAARHLESGVQVAVNGDEAFPMASTFKVAVAAVVLDKIDKGEVKLDQMVTVDARWLGESGQIADAVIHPGIALSVINLMELMITRSNNTATDRLVAIAGGPKAVTDWLVRKGIKGQRLDHDTLGLLRKYYEIPDGVPMITAFREATARDPAAFAARVSTPKPSFDADPADTSTPLAMLELLAKIWSGTLLSASSTEVLTTMMGRTGNDARLKGLLPAGTPLAHKTGTLGGTVNDVGVITLPDGRGHVAIAVYLKSGTAPIPVREKAVAEAARSAYDYFLLR